MPDELLLRGEVRGRHSRPVTVEHPLFMKSGLYKIMRCLNGTHLRIVCMVSMPCRSRLELRERDLEIYKTWMEHAYHLCRKED
jgi:hypothetical protein